MDDRPKPRREAAPKPRGDTALWFVAIGLAIAVFSRTMRDEMLGDVVMIFGLAFAVIAMVYWIARPKHGLPR